MSGDGPDLLSFESPEDEVKRLREENSRLQRLLTTHSIAIPEFVPPPTPAPTPEPPPPLDKQERARRRIALFRSLFRGSEDVYARRWEKNGRSGYGPADVKDWKAINRSRPEDRKRVAKKTRKFLPLTHAVIANHLRGEET